MPEPLIKSDHIRWNVISKDEGDPPPQHWFFVLDMKPREIGMVEQGLREELAPTTTEEITKGLISGSEGRHYKAIEVTSHRRIKPKDINRRNVYRGRWFRDKKLGTHRTADGTANYINNKYGS